VITAVTATVTIELNQESINVVRVSKLPRCNIQGTDPSIKLMLLLKDKGDVKLNQRHYVKLDCQKAVSAI
jgi:hypothetical protein